MNPGRPDQRRRREALEAAKLRPMRGDFPIGRLCHLWLDDGSIRMEPYWSPCWSTVGTTMERMMELDGACHVC